MTVAEPSVVALVAHARNVPLADREMFSEGLAAVPRGALVLETCHRVEAYTVTSDGREFLARVPPGGERLEGDRAVRHAIAVAVGLDSIVVGEDQILHQVRTTVAEARRARRLDPVLDRLFTLALRAGRRARSWQGQAPSLADAAVAAIERRVGPLRERQVLVVGAGRMAKLAADAAVGRGATVTIASRTDEHARALARLVGGAAAPFDPGPAIADFAGVVVALRGPWPLVHSSTEALATGTATVVDLSVPAAVAERVARRLDGRFVSADALATTEPAPARDDRLTSRLTDLVSATLEEYLTWVATRGQRAVAASLSERAEVQRRQALEELWRHLPGLGPEARAAIEAMSEHLADRLLHEPLERLGQDVDGRAEQAARDLFAL